jgi:monoamine oxidase
VRLLRNGMRTARKLRTKTDVLILGAGMSGISALAETQRRDLNAICLEARGKLGGRIRTMRNKRVAHYPIELGAEFVHGSHLKELYESLGLTLMKHPSDGDAYVDQQFHPLFPILQVFKTIRERAAAHLAAGHTDSSVEEFIEALTKSKLKLPQGLTTHLLLQIIRNDYATSVSELGLTGLLAPDVDGYEENYRMKEGYDEVPRRLIGKGEVRLNHTVTAIVRQRDGVDVLTNRGVYTGNVVLVCLPVGVLQADAVRFDPPLTDEKSAALNSMNAGIATKLVLCFRRTKMGTTFWPKTTPLLATSLATQLWWPTGWGHDDERYFLASCLVGGAAVQRFADREPRQVGLAQLAHMFGHERVQRKALSTYFLKSWHDDVLTKGGYSSLPVGVDQEQLLRELETPEDTEQPQLFFAGDYVSRHPGSVHAAYQSGIDAVQRAVAART